MKKYIEWEDTKAGKYIKLEYAGKIEDIEREAMNISRLWRAPVTNIIVSEKGEETTKLSIIRK